MSLRLISPGTAIAVGAASFLAIAAANVNDAAAADTTSCMEACLATYGFQFVDTNGQLRRYDYCTVDGSNHITCVYAVVP